MHTNVHSSIIYNRQDMEATQRSINRWMDKKDMRDRDIYTYIHKHTRKEHYSIIKKWSSAIFSKVGRPREYYAYWSKKDKYYMIITYMWNLKNNTN